MATHVWRHPKPVTTGVERAGDCFATPVSRKNCSAASMRGRRCCVRRISCTNSHKSDATPTNLPRRACVRWNFWDAESGCGKRGNTVRVFRHRC